MSKWINSKNNARLLGAFLLMIASAMMMGPAALGQIVGGALDIEFHSASPKGESATTYSGSSALRIWHDDAINCYLSRRLGSFAKGDTVSVSLWFRADEDVFGELWLGNAGDQAVWVGKEGNGHWQNLTASWTMTYADDMWLYLYGNASGSSPNATDSVLYDEVRVKSDFQGLIWLDSFEGILTLTADPTHLDHWYTAGQRTELVSQATTNTYNGDKAVRIWGYGPTNSSLSRYIGKFEQGDTVSVTLRFRADEDVFGELLLGDVGGKDPFDNAVTATKEGNGDWQSLTASWTMTHTDDMWLRIFGNASGSDPANITSVIYDDVAVASAQHGRIWVKGFENGLLLTDDHFEDAAWYSDGQPSEILTMNAPRRLDGPFLLWQLPSKTSSQMMSFVVQTENGSVIVIDGGYAGDAPYLRPFINQLGNHVSAWFISHPHSDHVGALLSIVSDNPPQIDHIYASLLSTPDPTQCPPDDGIPPDDGTWYSDELDLGNALHGQPSLMELELGQCITIDNVSVEILGIKNPEICAHLLNNSSVVMRVGNVERSILFPGDLMTEGGQKFFDPLMSPYLSRLESEYVQVSHHGNDGADESFYKVVNPRVAIWPMPYWLFTNDPSGSNDPSAPSNTQCQGDWTKAQVLCWMKDLNVQVHCYLFNVPADGAQLIPEQCGGTQLSPCYPCK